MYGRGGGKGASDKPYEAPNTLQSKSIARVVHLLSEGEIEGLKNGLQSVYINDVQLQNEDGSFNFNGVQVESRNGTPTQTFLPGFPSVQREVAVGVEVKNIDAPTVRSVPATDIDAINVKMSVPALFRQDEAGNIFANSISYSIDYKESASGTYKPVKTSRTEGVVITTGPDVSYSWITEGQTEDADVEGITISIGSGSDGKPQRDGVADVRLLRVASAEVISFEVRISPEAYVNKGGGLWQATTFRTIDDLTTGQWDIEVTQRQEDTPLPGDPASGASMALGSGTTKLAQGVFTITGKTTSAYEEIRKISLDGTGPWDVRITKTSPDSDDSQVQQTLTWSSYTEVTDARISYMDSAIVGISVDPELFGSQTPVVSFDLLGIKIQIPSNYDPVAREYTGIWDGTFQVAWSNNPAWVLYDLLTNARYGLGGDIDATMIDKFALYDIGVYCDEIVTFNSDGLSTTEPRFVFNGVLQSAKEAYTVINSIVSTFRGMVYWGNGTIIPVQDSPKDAVSIFSPANVIDGTFTYSGTSLKSRSTAVHVTWNNPLNGFKKSIAVVETPTGIQRLGYRKRDVVAFGCTSESQAYRYGKWILDSEENESEILTFSTSIASMVSNAGLGLRPGDIINVSDPSIAGVRMGGRVAAIDGGKTTVTIDSAITISASETYSMSVVNQTGEIETRTVTNAAGSYTEITLSSAITGEVSVGSMWGISASDVELRPFRVLSLVESDDTILTVTCNFYDANKFARVEQDINIEAPDFTNLPTGKILPASNLSVQEYIYEVGTAPKSAATISWTYSIDARVSNYDVYAQGPADVVPILVGSTSSNSLDVLDTLTGDYIFQVFANSLFGTISTPVELSVGLLALLTPPANVTDFNISVINDNSHLSWVLSGEVGTSYYKIKYQDVSTGSTWGNSIVLVPRVSRDSTGFTVPSLVGTYSIKAVRLVNGAEIESTAAVFISSNVASIAGLNVVQTLTEHSAFAGVRDDVVLDGGEIKLGWTQPMSEWATLTEVISLDVGNNATPRGLTGTYNFFNTSDLGAVYTSRLTANMMVRGESDSENMSEWVSLLDVNLLADTDPSAWNVTLQVADTQVDPVLDTYSDWKPFVVGDYTARAFKFRLLMETFNVNITPVVSELSVSVDMPDIVKADDDVVASASGVTVNYNTPFKAKPAIAIAAQDLATGDYHTITSATANGFNIEFFNSSDVSIERTFDYVAKGYGVQQ